MRRFIAALLRRFSAAATVIERRSKRKLTQPGARRARASARATRRTEQEPGQPVQSLLPTGELLGFASYDGLLIEWNLPLKLGLAGLCVGLLCTLVLVATSALRHEIPRSWLLAVCVLFTLSFLAAVGKAGHGRQQAFFGRRLGRAGRLEVTGQAAQPGPSDLVRTDVGQALLAFACLTGAVLAALFGGTTWVLLRIRPGPPRRYVDEAGRHLVEYTMGSSALFVSPRNGWSFSLDYSPWRLAGSLAATLAFLALSLWLGARLFRVG